MRESHLPPLPGPGSTDSLAVCRAFARDAVARGAFAEAPPAGCHHVITVFWTGAAWNITGATLPRAELPKGPPGARASLRRILARLDECRGVLVIVLAEKPLWHVGGIDLDRLDRLDADMDLAEAGNIDDHAN